MRRSVAFLTIIVASLAGSQSARADWNSFWHGVHVDFHRMNAWPCPFNAPNRAAVRNHWGAMTQKGWQLQNTLSHHHFDPDTQKLTHAGELKLRAIATVSPPQHRSVFVLRGAQPEVTAKRMEQVQEKLAGMIQGQPLAVLETSVEPRGRSGEYINTVHLKSQNAIPIPVLPPAGGETGN